MSLPATFANKVRTDTGCHIWIGATNNKGYGIFYVGGVHHLAHRAAYEAEFGAIPEGMVIDHLCRVRNCVNPNHLQPVTVAENNRRGRSAKTLAPGDYCTNGHFIDEGDLYVRATGAAECRHCRVAGSPRVNGVRKRPTQQRRADSVARDLDAVADIERESA